MLRSALIGLAMLVALAGVTWWALRPAPPTDEAQVRALVFAAASAAEARDAGAAVAGVSERFRGQAGEGLDRRGLEQYVAAAALRGAWSLVRPANVAVAVAGDGATARFDLVLAAAGAGGALKDLLPSQGSAWRVEARLEREPEGWRVVEASWRPVPLANVVAGDAPAR